MARVTVETADAAAVSPLDGRVAIIAGGSRGIGAATARLLAGRGAAVVVNYLSNAEAASATVSAIEDAGGKALAVQADIRDADDVKRLVDSTVDAYGRVDIAIVSVDLPFKPTRIMDMPWETFYTKVNDELAAAYHLTKAVLPLMKKNDYGRVIYLSSASVEKPGAFGLSAHATGKAALEEFALCAALEETDGNVTINVVSPALVRTDATTFLPEAFFEAQAKVTPLGRVADPDDIAGVVAFMASQESGYMTGAVVKVNGLMTH